MDISVHKSKDTYIGKFISQTWTYQQERETDFSNDGSRIVASWTLYLFIYLFIWYFDVEIVKSFLL